MKQNNLKNEIENKLLPKVEKPGRYIGGEWHSTNKTFKETKCQMAFCFPDVYEIGMSHLGMPILYGLVNEKTDFLMERVFCPWPDMATLMVEEKIPLFSLESYTPLDQFPIVGFTLQYEMSYTNILKMLALGNIPVTKRERKKGTYPIIIGGGPCAVNPEPLSDFFDIFLIGDGEELLPKVLEAGAAYLKNGFIKDREAFFNAICHLDGVYIPEWYEAKYEDGRYKGTYPIHDKANKKIRKAIVKNLDQAYFPTKPVVPFVDAIHDRMMLEVLRGCTHGCRFCQAGMIYRPVREKSTETLMDQAHQLALNTGYDDISLTSLSTADYTGVEPLVSQLMDDFKKEKISVSLPSLRVDTFSVNLAKMIQTVRKTGFTFAPEAGTQKMRDVINKGVTEEDLIETVTGAFKAGWKRIKLYFMIGLPEETDADVIGIADLGKKILALGKSLGIRGLTITISVSSFVPKPFTPFQWFGQNSQSELERKQRLLREHIQGKGLKFNYHSAPTSVLEGMLARGDRRLNGLLLKLHEKDCYFDSWDEWFKEDAWNEALNETGIHVTDYSEHFFTKEEPLYWDNINIGVAKAYLWKEYENAKKEAITRDCRKGCTGCTLCNEGDGLKLDLKGAYHG